MFTFVLASCKGIDWSQMMPIAMHENFSTASQNILPGGRNEPEKNGRATYVHTSFSNRIRWRLIRPFRCLFPSPILVHT